MSCTTRDDFNKRLTDIVGKDHVQELEQRGYLAAQIVRHRHHQHMSQQELATALGVAKSTIGRLEAGLTQPRYSTLVALSRVLDAPILIDANYENHPMAKM